MKESCNLQHPTCLRLKVREPPNLSLKWCTFSMESNGLVRQQNPHFGDAQINHWVRLGAGGTPELPSRVFFGELGESQVSWGKQNKQNLPWKSMGRS